jgi:solute carrier family 45 protein 1/2/4
MHWPDCTPYLLALGLTKSRTSLVWIAGPLSGLIMQPIVGVIADRSKSKYGRRRPFMIIGSLIVAGCLLLLGWTKEIVGMFIGDPDMVKTCSIAVAVLSIYALDFAVNAGKLRYDIVYSCTAPLSKC